MMSIKSARMYAEIYGHWKEMKMQYGQADKYSHICPAFEASRSKVPRLHVAATTKVAAIAPPRCPARNIAGKQDDENGWCNRRPAFRQSRSWRMMVVHRSSRYSAASEPCCRSLLIASQRHETNVRRLGDFGREQVYCWQGNFSDVNVFVTMLVLSRLVQQHRIASCRLASVHARAPERNLL
jgi:hypothetical protein